MIQTVSPGARSGTVWIPASKSCAHRMLICAALSDGKSRLLCDGISKDIAATVQCLTALGAQITQGEPNVFEVTPVGEAPKGRRELHCGESGSTLRFLLPVVGALGADAAFCMEGLLPERPHNALTDELCRHGMHIEKDKNRLLCSGQLRPGDYVIAGNISSQFVSGLLFALPLLGGDSTLTVTGTIESSDYIAMTESARTAFGVTSEKEGNRYFISGQSRYTAADAVIEKDWSNAAFFLCMGAVSPQGITLPGLCAASVQGDRRILNILRSFGADVTVADGSVTVRKNKLIGQTVDASEIPDLVPTIAALASGAEGITVIRNASRLRFKESDRLQTTAEMLSALGADITQTEDGLRICGKTHLSGGTVNAHNDHRIAMAAAVAACHCTQDVTVNGAECVAKSYPRFWEDLKQTEVQK